MYLVKKSKADYIFNKLRERIAFLFFMDDGTYIMYHDEKVLCYSTGPVEIAREDIEAFEKTGELPELVKRIKARDFQGSASLGSYLQ